MANGLSWKSALDPTFGDVSAGSITPAGGASISASATGTNRRMATSSGSGPNAVVVGNSSSVVFPAGNFVVGMVVLAVLVAIVMFVAHRFGGADDDFANVRASAYNILIISLLAAVGLPVIKVGAYQLGQIGIPGADHVYTWVSAA